MDLPYTFLDFQDTELIHKILNSNWHDWLRKSLESYLNLKSYYEKVYVIGLSMGGVLTALIAEKFEPEKIVLAAPLYCYRLENQIDTFL